MVCLEELQSNGGNGQVSWQLHSVKSAILEVSTECFENVKEAQIHQSSEQGWLLQDDV